MSTFQRGITDVESIERLARLQNTKVYMFWPNQPNLHAKCWLFLYDNNNHDTVIIGSSNLTSSSMSFAVKVNVVLRRDQYASAGKFVDDLRQPQNDRSLFIGLSYRAFRYNMEASHTKRVIIFRV